ncbi:MAG TPA: tetratricopeptide repeat protein [Verrucomicrobiae bacterium]
MAAGGLAVAGVIAAWRMNLHRPPAPPTQAMILAEYAGSAACAGCHRDEFEAWAKSHHGLAEQLVHGTKYEAIATNASSPREARLADRVIGCDPLAQFLASAPGGRWQALSTAWDPHRKEWFDIFGAEQRQPGEWGHWTGRGMNWNSQCAACHNSRLFKNYDQAADTYHTTMAERTVGCESCHGPLQAHVQWQRQHGNSGQHDTTVPRMTPRQQVETCGSCHSRRSELTADFKPGGEFLDHFELAMVDGSGVYYPDGQVHGEDYEYASFLGSRMHAGGVRCVDCHDPHSAKPRLPGNFLCLRCHNGAYPNAPVINPVAHSHHRAHGYNSAGVLVDADLMHFKPEDIKETGGECVNCHMPQTVYMQRHARHDHGFTIPDPLLSKQFGVPNACNRCHADKDANWALAQTDKWYGKLMERPTRLRAIALAEARAGNAASVETLLKILPAETNSYWKAAIINVLQPWTSEPPVDAMLRQCLGDTNALVRERAVRVLGGDGDLPSESAAAALRARLEDPMRGVRMAAAWALRATLDTNSLAGRELESLLDFHADQPQGQLQRGEFLLARGERQPALAYYRKAAEWDPSSAAVRRDLAVLYASLNDNSAALEQLREAVRLEPGEAEYHYSLALALSDAGDLDQAIAQLQETTRLNPRHAAAWRNLGLALASKEDLPGALDALARAESIAPNDPRIPFARATVLARMERLPEARAACARALELRPDYSEAQDLMRTLRPP